jgi:hypothetical protein
VSLSGGDYEELTSLTYSNGVFFGGDLGDSDADMPRLYQLTVGGFVTVIGDMDHVSKGLVLAAPPPPNDVPALSLPMMGLLGVALLLVGAGRATRRGTSLSSAV